MVGTIYRGPCEMLVEGWCSRATRGEPNRHQSESGYYLLSKLQSQLCYILLRNN